jgi:hypothetical protein
MLKGKFAVLSLAAAAVLCLQLASVDTVNSGVVDPCNSSATSAGTYPADITDVVFACPQSDGDPFGPGLTISVTVRDNVNAAVAGIPAADVWLVGCNDNLALCGGSGAISASAATDVNGNTTITGDLSAGGCDTGLRVVVQGVVIGAGVCADPCVAIAVRSADINETLSVNLADFALFGAGYTSPPKPYNACLDYVAGFGAVNLADFARFGAHYNHVC